MKYVPKYCIINCDGKVLIRTEDRSLKLVSVDEKDLVNQKDVCYFNTADAAENYIWKYGYLDIDPTLRPFQL